MSFEGSTPVSIPTWFTVDTKLGCLSVHLNAPQCFSAEMYSADLNIVGKLEVDKEHCLKTCHQSSRECFIDIISIANVCLNPHVAQELVAELVTVNGFKAAYAIKDGAEGPRGWMET
ncbi:hypothetical protein K1719_022931 [Acacia pycnantha]|nr:hypothetical protein K1719_022931 [Acacia pycnantha]